MERSYDVVIIGGGVVGSSVAYHLASDAGFGGSIAVVERDPYYATASSSLSTSAIRQQFGTRPNIAMSMYSIGFLRQAEDLLTVDGDRPEIGLREPGYLVLATPSMEARLLANHAVQREMGVEVELLKPDAMTARMPWLNTEDLALGSLGLSREGWFDGPALHQAFRRKARSLGVEYLPASVVGLGMDRDRRVNAVRLDGGESLKAGTVVNAAGAWSGEVARMAGITVPVFPRKRCVFVFDSPQRIDRCPFVFDTSGFWMRAEGHLYLCGMPPSLENHDEDFGMEVSYDMFEEVIWPALAHRVPGFEQLKMLRAWAGLY